MLTHTQRKTPIQFYIKKYMKHVFQPSLDTLFMVIEDLCPSPQRGQRSKSETQMLADTEVLVK